MVSDKPVNVPTWFWAYRLLIAPLMLAAMLIIWPFSKKIRKGLKMRMKPGYDEVPSDCLWVHAASGEYEYAKPVLRALERQTNDPRFVSYFSPSYEKHIKASAEATHSAPLPLDLPGPVYTFFKKIKPKVLMISRTDFWPEVLMRAAQTGVPSYVFSYTQRKVSGFSALLRRPLLNQMKTIFCVSHEDKANLADMGVTAPIVITGDTRFDQVMYRLKHPKLESIVKKENPETLHFIAGSTWPEDERPVFKALYPLLKDKKISVIWAPHEPGMGHYEDQRADARDIPFQRFSEWIKTPDEAIPAGSILYVDQVGVLADLYRSADAAFVGGSFKRYVHSVMEPLACGLTTWVGPFHHNNREALDFKHLQTACGKAVREFGRAEDLRLQLEEFMSKSFYFEETKETIHREAETRTGASELVVKKILKDLHP
jgi:3-deoxy-D-manno-octulosonic-acid transferase